MPEERAAPTVSLEATSPYELRVNLGNDVPETDVRTALSTGDMGFLHSFTTGATVDGPGVRVVAWTSGCMFRCTYCHNPDTWTMSNGYPLPSRRRCRSFASTSGDFNVMSGGFTLSGGEPLMQHRFAVKLLGAARQMGVHTALDTNGVFGDRLSDDELLVADLVMLDIKQWDPVLHKALTGMDNGPVLEFARRLAAKRRPVWLRYVLVPGVTDNFDGIAKLAKFTADLGNVERVDVLPFHQMGKYKWAKLGLTYTLEDVKPADPILAERVCEVFRAEGLKSVLIVKRQGSAYGEEDCRRHRAEAPQRRARKRNPVEEVGAVSQRAAVGNGSRRLQRGWERLELLLARPVALARLPVGRRRHCRDLRRPAAAVLRDCSVERARSDLEGAPVRTDQQRGESRRGRQGVLLLPR